MHLLRQRCAVSQSRRRGWALIVWLLSIFSSTSPYIVLTKQLATRHITAPHYYSMKHHYESVVTVVKVIQFGLQRNCYRAPTEVWRSWLACFIPHLRAMAVFTCPNKPDFKWEVIIVKVQLPQTSLVWMHTQSKTGFKVKFNRSLIEVWLDQGNTSKCILCINPVMCVCLCEQSSGVMSSESAVKMVCGLERIPVNVKTTRVRWG